MRDWAVEQDAWEAEKRRARVATIGDVERVALEIATDNDDAAHRGIDLLRADFEAMAERHKDVTEGRIARFGSDLARAMSVLSRVMDPEAWEQRSDLQLGVVANDLEIVKVRSLVDHERRFAALEARVAELEGRS